LEPEDTINQTGGGSKFTFHILHYNRSIL